MQDEKGFAVIFLVIGAVLLVIVLVIGGNFISKSPNSQSTGQSTTSSRNSQDQSHGNENAGGGNPKAYNQNAVFYNDSGIVIEHNFPGENNLSSEESEMYVYNESGSEITFTKTSMDYLIDGVAQGGKSGTWELFPDWRSWEMIQYTNIGEQYNDDTPLVVKPGQKAKIHYHYNVGNSSGDHADQSSSSPVSESQSVQINLAFTQDGKTQTINQTLEK